MSFGTRLVKSRLSNRLTAVYASLFAVLLLLLSAGIFFAAYQLLLQKQIGNISITAELMADNLLEEIDEQELLTNPEILEEQNSDPNLTIFVYNREGEMVNRVLNFPVSRETLPRADASPVLILSDGNMLLCVSRPIQDSATNYGSLYLVQNLQNEANFLELLGLLLICANLIGAVAASLVGHATSRRMLAPIGRMITAANQIGSTTLDARLDVPEPNDELKSLALTINGMLERVSTAYHRQGRFVADVSHELRTPLAVMQGNIDLLTRWGSEDKAVLQDSIRALEKQTTYMNQLVENLLFLARCDNAQARLNKTEFSVSELFDELIEEQTLIDPAHSYEICSMPDDDYMTADRAMIRQMLRALIDNSVKYTPEGGKIELNCDVDSLLAELSVTDNGVGMEEEHCAQIFERFYRVDQARARSTGGMGLGLSIVSAIAQSHGGFVSAKSTPGNGTTITITLPQ